MTRRRHILCTIPTGGPPEWTPPAGVSSVHGLRRQEGGRLLTVLLLMLMVAEAACGLDWTRESWGRRAVVSPAAGGRTGFRLLDPAVTGIRWTNDLPSSIWLTNVMFLNGSGIAAGDVDGDGHCDLIVAGLIRPTALFHNRGDGTFIDATPGSGLEGLGLMATGGVLADIDGDDDLDLILNSFGQGTQVFKNDSRGHFSRSQVFNQGRGASSAGLADFDGDGDLDLYVANYRAWSFRDRPDAQVTIDNQGGVARVTHFEGRPVSEPDLEGRFSIDATRGLEEHGEVHLLLRNNGQGVFEEVDWTSGVFLDETGATLKTAPHDWGLSVMFRDLNGDMLPDLYVCNDFASPDRVWINDGQGHLRALSELAIRSSSRFSMGIDVADVNRDGVDDLYVVDMLSPHHAKRHLQLGNLQSIYAGPGDFRGRLQYSRNTLQLGRGDGSFAEIGAYANASATEWTWGVVFLDVDLDGYEDILTTAGNEIDSMNIDITNEQLRRRSQRKFSAREVLDLRLLYPRLEVPKMALRNQGNLTFTNVGTLWGYGSTGVACGIVQADLDGDGDLDLVVNPLNGPLEIYRNEGMAPRLSVRLRSTGPNTRGIGARIQVTGGAVQQSQVIVAGGRYLSSDDPCRVFAASPNSPMRVEVRWPSGRRSVVDGLKANQVCEIQEPPDAPARRPTQAEPPAPKPLFRDVSTLLGHSHQEDSFDDFERQPLLPIRLSQLGPGVCWHDLDGDGWEDLAVGSGRGGMIGFLRNRSGREFLREMEAPFNRRLGRDQTTVLGLGGTLIVGSANYEDGQSQGGALRIYSWDGRATGESVTGLGFSVGPMTMADLDSDGDMDMFVGGRSVPGRYPEPADAVLLRNEGGRFVVQHRWPRLGLATGALFADLDGDAGLELVVACEWGPIRVFRMRGLEPVEITGSLGLQRFPGRWSGVAVVDADGDGRLDLVAGNWGLNHFLHPFAADGLHLVHGEFSGGTGVDVVEAYRDRESGQLVPSRVYSATVAAMPGLRESVPDYTTYSRLTVSNLLGDHFAAAGHVHASTLESMIFLNRGGVLEAHPLPMQAQWAPVFGITACDFDGDGREDLFLSQNFFAVNPDASRLDAGRGLLLLGDGHGGFAAQSADRSGIRIHGEQRGCAAADFDHDGRMDLAVSQNAAETVLLHNEGAAPGLRVRLAGDRDVTGTAHARLRPVRSGVAGPVRELQAGSGYWSQDAPAMVFHGEPVPEAIQVRWPGGRPRSYPLPSGALEVLLHPDGRVEKVR